MSKFNLVSSFWLVPLHPNCMKCTAFLHEGKCYEFRVTPFKLKTSTAALLRALDLILGGLGNFVITFVDDMLCTSQCTSQHLCHLERLFQRLQDHSVTVNFEKSHFFCP